MNRPYPDKRANRVWEEPAMSLADATAGRLTDLMLKMLNRG